MRFTYYFRIATVANSFIIIIIIIFFINNSQTSNTVFAMSSSPTSSNSVSRSIARVVLPTQTNPAITRLVGTVDIDGAGTQHSLPEVDPFILLDQGTIDKNNMPPFGPHPHRGHSVVTIILQGSAKNWDSCSSPENSSSNSRPPLQGPASYWVDAGSGLFHDERSIIENEDDPSQHFRIFQLWVGVAEADRSKPPRVQYTDSLPTLPIHGSSSSSSNTAVKVGVGQATHYVGEGTGIETMHPISVVHVTQHADTTHHVPIMNPRHGGFVVHIKGKATYGGAGDGETVETPNSVVVLKNIDDDDSAATNVDHLQVSTAGSTSDVEYLVCTGERIQEPWCKKLVANGAIITKTEEEGRELAIQVEAMSKAGKADGGSFAPFGV
jgi:redox-sensitive bicupin YhaK (pirin superfamily)